jgi:hypothetical protein
MLFGLAKVEAMARVNLSTARPVEYFMLVEPRPDGEIVGTYAGRPIHVAVVDYFGRRYTYLGVAPRLRSGRYDVESLAPGEWIVEPGLVYYSDPDNGGDLLSRLRKIGGTAK